MPTDLEEILAFKKKYAAIVEAEKRERADPSKMDIEHPPNVVGVSKADTIKGYQIVRKPFAMRCKNGHHIPAGAPVFTDQKEWYCPYCGAHLDIA